MTPSGPTLLERALDLLEHLHYERAVEVVLELRKTEASDPAAAYYLALARLRGRRPRGARLDVIKQVEADLDMAGYLAGDDQPAHFWFLRALVKHDFHRLKGLAIQPLAIEELLAEAKAAAADREELQRLLNHVPVPYGPVREAIEQRLRDLT